MNSDSPSMYSGVPVASMISKEMEFLHKVGLADATENRQLRFSPCCRSLECHDLLSGGLFWSFPPCIFVSAFDVGIRPHVHLASCGQVTLPCALAGSHVSG